MVTELPIAEDLTVRSPAEFRLPRRVSVPLTSRAEAGVRVEMPMVPDARSPNSTPPMFSLLLSPGEERSWPIPTTMLLLPVVT